ncbi:MAG: ATP synthase F1 subunit epsilon [Mycoplasmataceae bacterium]|nr:ATP synthase F1 subunit epsilon [Mycoplasmataceae bacterium]
MTRNKIKLKIVTPEKIFYEDYVDVFTIKTIEGFIGLMKGHIPFISLIKPCTFTLNYDEGTRKEKVVVSRGVIYTDGSMIQVITNDIVMLGKDSLKKARKELENLKQELKKAEEQSAQYMSIDSRIQDKIKEINIMEK